MVGEAGVLTVPNASPVTALTVRLLRHPRAVILALLALVLLVGHRAPLTRQDNAPETFFAADPAARATYREMVSAFGGDELVLVELRGARLSRPDHVARLAALALQARALTGVHGVVSVADSLPAEVRSGVRPPHPEELTPLAREASSLTVYGHLGLVRPGVPALGVLLTVVMQGGGQRQRFNRSLAALLEQHRVPGLEPSAAGLTPANAAIDRETRRATGIYLPLTGLTTVLVGLLLFRSLWAVLAMFLPVGGAVAMGVGTLQLLDEPINLVTGVMPPLVLAIAFAGAVHLVSRYARLLAGGLSVEQAVAQTVRDKLFPTAFAFFTTALGFGSLALSPVRPVRVLGLVSAGALLAALVLVSLGTPALLLMMRPRPHAPGRQRRLLSAVAAWALARRAKVIMGAALVLLPLGLGAARLTSSIDGMALLADHVPEKRAFTRLEREGLGLNAVDIWLPSPVPDRAALLAAAPPLRRLARELERDAMVTGSVGVHDLLELIQLRSTGRPGLPASLDILDLMEDSERHQLTSRLSPFWSPDRGLKLTLLTREATPHGIQRLKQAIRDGARRQFPGQRPRISGHFMMLIGTPGALIQTLGSSLAVTGAVIALLFMLAFRSVGLCLSGLVASLLPVFGVLGIMGWLGVPVDVATVMTGSVAFGLAVDDTFHYLHFRQVTGSMTRAAGAVGQGIVATTFMIGAGFLVLGLSGFTPVVRFGLLTALAVVLALILDAVLLPALVGDKS